MIYRIVRGHQRHMAVRACRGLGGVVKRSRTLPRHAAGLPIVVVVESTEPAIVVYGNIQMDFVAGRAEFGGVLAHEGFHEGAAMWFRIEVRQKVVERVDDGILAGGKLVQRRIFYGESAVTHGAVDVNNGV